VISEGSTFLRRAAAAAVVIFLAILSAALPFVHGEDAAAGPAKDPFPIRRVVLSPERAAQEIERLGPNVLIQMPLNEFNDLVQRAAKVKAIQEAPPPRLIAASYSARLDGEDLRGDAHWKLINPGAAGAVLSLYPLNLALLKQPHFENRPALVAEIDDHPALPVDAPGEHSLMMDWSARGNPRPGGLRFDLRFPPAVAALLELDLPPDHLVSLEEPAQPIRIDTNPPPDPPLLSGPHDAGVPGLRRWKISCPGRWQVAFRIRSLAADTTRPAVVLCRQETTQVLRPGSIECRYKYLLEAPRRGVRELLFECDPGLIPWDVSVQGPQAALKDWEVHRERGGVMRLTVRLGEPVEEATVLIEALGPLPTLGPMGAPVPVLWTSPNVRPLGVVNRGEELELKIDPDLRLADWQPGDFRLAGADQEVEPAERELLRRLTLVGGGLLEDSAAARDGGVDSRRPSVRLLAAGPVYRARQLAWWQVRSAGESLTVRVTYEVMHGTLEQLPLLFPGDWDVEAVTIGDKLLNNSRVDRSRGRPVLLVELNEPLRATARLGSPAIGSLFGSPAGASGVALPPRATATLTVRLRPRQPRKVLTFPETDPLAPVREGALGIDVDEQVFQAVPRTTVARGQPDAKDEGPWGQQAPLFYYPCTGQPITGLLDVKPRPGQARARCTTDVFLSGDRPAVEVRLTLDAEAGSSDVVDVAFSEAGSGPWEWRGSAGGAPLRAERVPREATQTALARLGARTPLDAAGLALLPPRGETWRVVLPRALRGADPVQVIASRHLDRADGHYPVPLPLVVGAERFEGEVSLHLSGGDVVHVEPSGLREVAPAARARPGAAWRTFSYGGAPGALELRVQPGSAPGTVAASAEIIDQARLTTYLGPGDVLQHHFAFQAANWPQPRLLLALPPGARPVAAQADGEILSLLPAWFKLTDAALAGLRSRGVPAEVLARLGAMKDRELGRHAFVQALADVLEQNDRERFQNAILSQGALAEWLELPMPERAGSGDGWHRFEVVYLTDAPAWALWSRAESLAPRVLLPGEPPAEPKVVVPIRFRRSWRLPPGVEPLSESGLRRLPGPGEADAPPRRAPRPADLFRLGPLATDLLAGGQWPGAGLDTKQREALADAGLEVRSARAGATLPLGEAIGRVADTCLRKARLPLVVDAVALREARLGAQTRLTVEKLESGDDSRQPWEPLGLVTVFAHSVPVLTTRRQAELWDVLGEPRRPLPDELEEAVSVAARQGHDPSGRFVIAPAWLRHEAELYAAQGSVAFEDEDGTGPWSLLSPGLTLGHWTEWEPVADTAAPGRLVVVGRGAVTTGGILLATAALLVFWRIGRHAAWRRSWFLGPWLASSGAGLFLLPSGLHGLAWWPFLAAAAVALGWYVIALARATPRRPLTPAPRPSGERPRGGGPAGAASGVAAATLALFALSAWLSAPERTSSAEPDRAPPPVVYLVPGPTPDKSIALLPRELQDRLVAAARPPDGPAALLLSAVYDGKVVDGAALFKATFRAHSLADGTATVVLPLDGVDLVGDAEVDGKPARDITLAPNKGGLAVKVGDRGLHRIELSFRVPVVVGASGERGTRFTVPRLDECRLVFQVPPGGARPVTLFRLGSRSEKDGLLRAELGRVGTVHVLWHNGSRVVADKDVRIREEAYLWNLRAGGSSLTAVIRYEIPNGVVPGLTVDLPRELEVREAEVLPPASPDAGPPRTRQQPRLRDWRVNEDGGRRWLRLDFQNPIGGACDVRLECVPRYPLGARNALLPLPVPHGARSGEPGYLAYRTDGVEAQLRSVLRVTNVEAARFVHAWPAELRADLGILAYSCSFRREDGQGPELRLQLRPKPPPAHAVLDVALRASTHHTDVRAAATLTVRNRDTPRGKESVALVEWDVQLAPPQLTVLAVAGRGVRSWSQTGRRVQIWLEQGMDTVKLELTARLAPLPGKEGTLDVPALRLLTAQTQQTTVRLSAGPGLTLTPMADSLRNLTQVGDSPNDERDQVFSTTRSSYGGTWTVQPAVCEAAARVLTVVEARQQRLDFTSTILFHVKRGELRTVWVRLRDWDGTTVEVSAPATLRRGPGGQRVWAVELPPGVTGDYRLTVRDSLPLSAAGAGVWAPDVSVVVGTPTPDDGARANETLERWLVVAGLQLVAEAPPGLSMVPDVTAALVGWPNEAARLRGAAVALWKLPAEPLPRDLETRAAAWRLRLLPRDRERPAEAVQVFLGEQTALVADGRHWLHEATYWLRHEANAEMNVVLPAPGRVVAASLDGIAVAPLQPEPTRLWLPLPRRPGVRWVRLRWVYDDEALTAPNLNRPILDGARDGPVLWSVQAPNGFQATQVKGPDLRSGLARAAVLDLYRAAAQAEIVRQLIGELPAGDVEGTKSEFAAAQRRFYQYCRQAEHFLGAAPADTEDVGPDRQRPTDWLAQLLEQNRDLCKRSVDLERIRDEAERQAEQVRAVRPVPEPAPSSRSAAEPTRFAGMGRSRVGASGTALPERGTPFGGCAGPDAAPPVLRLTPESETETRAALLGASWWLGLLTAVWLLTLLPPVLRWTRPFWPEVLLLLGALGWYIAGPRSVPVALLTAWAGVRLVRVARFGLLLWHRWTVRVSTVGSGAAARR
jgi:hypothetical protein